MAGVDGDTGHPAADLLSLDDVETFHSNLLKELDVGVTAALQWKDARTKDAFVAEEAGRMGKQAFVALEEEARAAAAKGILPPTRLCGVAVIASITGAEDAAEPGRVALAAEDASAAYMATAGREILDSAEVQLAAALGAEEDATLADLVEAFIKKLGRFANTPAMNPEHLQLNAVAATVRGVADALRQQGARARLPADALSSPFKPCRAVRGGATGRDATEPRAERDDDGTTGVVAANDDDDDIQLTGQDFGDELARRTAKVHASTAAKARIASVQPAAAAAAETCQVLSREATWLAELHERVSDAIVGHCEVGVGRLECERLRRQERLAEGQERLAALRDEASTTLSSIVELYEQFVDVAGEMQAAGAECRLLQAKCAAASTAQDHLSTLVYKSVDAHQTTARAAGASAALADLTVAFLRDVAAAAAPCVAAALARTDEQLTWRRRVLCDVAEQYVLALQGHQEQALRTAAAAESKLRWSRGQLGVHAVARLNDNRARAENTLSYIEGVMEQVRCALDDCGALDGSERGFLAAYDARRQQDRAQAFFDALLAKLRDAGERLANIIDTPPDEGSEMGLHDLIEVAAEALHDALLHVADEASVEVHSAALPAQDLPSTINRVKRSTRTMGMTYEELGAVDAALLKHTTTVYAIAEGEEASSLAQLAAHLFPLLDRAIQTATAQSCAAPT